MPSVCAANVSEIFVNVELEKAFVFQKDHARKGAGIGGLHILLHMLCVRYNFLHLIHVNACIV